MDKRFDYNVDDAFFGKDWVRRAKARFKGSKGRKPPAQPGATARSRLADVRIGGAIERALAGFGLEPRNIRDMNLKGTLSATNRSFMEAKDMMGGRLRDVVQGDDARPMEYLSKLMERTRVTAMDDIRTAHKDQAFTDKKVAQDMAVDEIAGAQRMGAQISNIYNAGNADIFRMQQQYGTFASNISQGFGGLAGSMAAQKHYARIAQGGSV